MTSRTIVVPKDVAAQHALNYDEATSEQLIELALEESAFKTLWEAGFFQRVNAIAGVNIDVYEDECIEDPQQLKNVLESDVFTENSSIQVKEIKSLFELAIKFGTGIYFYF